MSALNGKKARIRQELFEDRAFRFGPLVCLLAAAVASYVFGSHWSSVVAPAPWILSLLVVGLPHGAADLAVANRLCHGSATSWLLVSYFAGMAIVFGLLMFVPLPVIAIFTVLSIWHFGLSHADGQSPPMFLDSHGIHRWPQVAAALARGGSVLGVPMVAWPNETAAVVERLLRLVGNGSIAPEWSNAFSSATVGLAGVWVLSISAAAFAAEALAARETPGGLGRSFDTLVDLAVIGLLGVTADPLFSVGLYFLLWHAWRHMRLLGPVVADVQPDTAATLGRSLVRIHKAALPLLVPTWAALCASWWFLSESHSWRDLSLLSLVVYLIVTPSHDVLIDFLRARTRATQSSMPDRSAEILELCVAQSPSCSC